MQVPIRDEQIQKLIKSWNPAIKLLLITIALFSTAPVTNLAWHFILYIFSLISNQEYYYLVTNTFDYLILNNARLGGFVLFCLFLIWKKGKIANIVLASPAGYKKISINNVYLRSIVYLLVIIISGFSFQG
ncbi:MAG: hypothetical protein AAB958_01445, partial [Patescibacteria group bacterium]